MQELLILNGNAPASIKYNHDAHLGIIYSWYVEDDFSTGACSQYMFYFTIQEANMTINAIYNTTF